MTMVKRRWGEEIGGDNMTTIQIEILESEVDDLLEILYTVETPLITPAVKPLAERIADRIIAAAVEKVDHEE